MDHLYGLCLTEAMNTPNTLLKSGGVPGWLKDYDCRGHLQVQSHTASIGRKKYLAVGIFSKPSNQLAAFPCRHNRLNLSRAVLGRGRTSPERRHRGSPLLLWTAG